MSLVFRKFPEFNDKGLRLIWDSRQERSSGIEEIVYLRKGVSEEIKEALLSRKPKTVIDDEEEELSFGEYLAKLTSNPDSSCQVVGVTGTNGKTSSVALLRHLYLSKGRNVLELGTLGASYWTPTSLSEAKDSIETGFTTPDAPILYDILSQLKERVDVVLMEVSSHALKLGRVDGLSFDGAIWTNFSQDHLDFHKSVGDYFNSKALLFSKYLVKSLKKKKVAIFHSCLDSKNLGTVLKKNGVMQKNSEFQEHIISKGLEGFLIKYKNEEIKIPLVGKFQLENLQACLSLLEELSDWNSQDLLKVMESFLGVPGRMQFLKLKDGNTAYVDYAHTPDALVKALKAIRVLMKRSSKLVLVFGCGGDRDPSKRAIMGKVAEDFADMVVVTNDNPRSENPKNIVKDILGSVKNVEAFYVELDRKKAIEYAVDQLQPSDVLLVAGKGHENYQIVGSLKNYFSDFEEISLLVIPQK